MLCSRWCATTRARSLRSIRSHSVHGIAANLAASRSSSCGTSPGYGGGIVIPVCSGCLTSASVIGLPCLLTPKRQDRPAHLLLGQARPREHGPDDVAHVPLSPACVELEPRVIAPGGVGHVRLDAQQVQL